MSELKQVRLPKPLAEDLGKIAKRDGFSVPRALEIICRKDVEDLKAGRIRLGGELVKIEEGGQ